MCSIDRESWRRVLGDRIAQRSEPEAIHGNTLTVLVSSSVWAQELSLLAPEIIGRLQDAGFSISELRWRVGRPKSAVPSKLRPAAISPLKRLPSNLQQALRSVTDAELHAAISEAAAYVMARQQQALCARSINAKQPGAQGPRYAAPRTSQQGPNDYGPHGESPRTRAKRQG